MQVFQFLSNTKEGTAMHSSLIGMVEKAHRYSEEKERVSFGQIKATIRGENDTHEVGFNNGEWHCTCEHFTTGKVCSHTMAMERILTGMVPEKAPAHVASALR